MKMKSVIISTDGSCLGNGHGNAYGGWAAILTYGTHRKEIYGGERNVTNNRMELLAVIKGAQALTLPCEIIVASDSKYVGTTISNMQKLAENNWKSDKPYEYKNMDMIQDLWQVLSDGKHTIKFQYIQGHSGDPNNERADALARSSAKALKALDEAGEADA